MTKRQIQQDLTHVWEKALIQFANNKETFAPGARKQNGTYSPVLDWLHKLEILAEPFNQPRTLPRHRINSRYTCDPYETLILTALADIREEHGQANMIPWRVVKRRTLLDEYPSELRNRDTYMDHHQPYPGGETLLVKWATVNKYVEPNPGEQL